MVKKNNFACTSRVSARFFAIAARLRRKTSFIGDINTRQQFCFSFSALFHRLLNSSAGKFADNDKVT